jgi:ubiquitin carboxyl-terminal hydrolase 9/13
MKTAPPRPPFNPNNGQKKPAQQPTARNSSGQQPGQQKPEDKESPEYKKKQALMTGPILNMGYQNAGGYEMPESLFTATKDIFEAVVTNQGRSGVISPTKFLETLRKENEMFRSAMHQDAHEFLNLLLNTVIENVEAHDKILKQKAEAEPRDPFADDAGIDEEAAEHGTVSFPSVLPAPSSESPAKMFHDLFEGKLTSETRCLTCENTSQRDEPFLDLSVDLEQHSSVTACLRRFSEEEMLCERNKFHCDNCGGLQEAEKRMKIKRLPKILALHLKRFKYTEDLQRLQKLFHKVVYPYHLRLFNTTDDAEDPDRLYELYAVVVHIGGGPYHGHYVAIIKTQDRGWLLFDDEMVEPVDRNYVKNFFGDKAGMACAYVLFYQETTLEQVQKEQRSHGKRRGSQSGEVGLTVNMRESAELHRVVSDATSPSGDTFANLDHAATAPALMKTTNGHVDPPKSPIATTAPAFPRPVSPVVQSKKGKAKEEKAAEKARKAAEKAAEKERVEAEKERRKQLSIKLQDAHKRQEADLKAAMEASKVSAAEEAKMRDVDGAVGSPGVGASPANGNGTPSGLDRFRRSKSLRFGSLGGGKKEKETVVASMPTSTSMGGVGGGLARAATEGEKLGSAASAQTPAANGNGSAQVATDSSTALVDGEEAAGTPAKDGGKKEKHSRFSIRKKSFGML